jgi:hypothetical protein
MWMQWVLPFLMVTAVSGELGASEGRASAGGHMWLASVSVNHYQHLPDSAQLRFCDDDARDLIGRLRAGNGVDRDHIAEFRGDAVRPEYQPTRENLVRQLPLFLSQAKEGDSVILFLSMHGVQLPDSSGQRANRTYLLPADASPEAGADTWIDIEWLREQLHTVKAKNVVLLLDACHAGAIRDIAANLGGAPLNTRNVETVFKQRTQAPEKTVYTLVSCGSGQSSLESEELKHGLFTYWLLAGLDGAADVDGNSEVTMDEVFKFVQQRVPQAAAYYTRVLDKVYEQRPERFFCGPNHGDIPLLKLPTVAPGIALERCANILHATLQQTYGCEVLRGNAAPKRIGIIEFSSVNHSGQRELRGSLGAFGRISRDVLEREMLGLAQAQQDTRAYHIVPARKLEASLKNIELTQVEDGVLNLDANVPADSQVDALLIGSYTRLGGDPDDANSDRLLAEVKLLDVKNKLILFSMTLTIPVNRELWVMLGTSRDANRPNKAPTQLISAAQPAPASQSSASDVDAWNLAQSEPHPQYEPQQATMAVTISQGPPGAPKKQVDWLPPCPDEPNLLAFETERGQELALNLTNRTTDWLAVIVQIDGLNQIGRTATLPSKAIPWLFPPKSHVVVDQWLDAPAKSASGGQETEMKLEGRKLLVVSPPESLAGQMNMTDQLGEIRVLVYATKTTQPGTRSSSANSLSVAVGEGVKAENRFPIYRNRAIDLDRNLATYVIRYCNRR